MERFGNAIDIVENSYLRIWVMKLPLRHQGTLMTAMRGCDLAPKYPLDSYERRLTAAIRFAAANPCDQREVDSEPGCFMISEPPTDLKPSALGHYPHHWVMHVIHACEIIGYCHPDENTANKWRDLYERFCKSLHVTPETRAEMHERLTEDRIASGNIVS